MANDPTSSATYARALFEATGSNASQVYRDLRQLVEAIEEDPRLWETLQSPRFTATQQKQAFDKLYADDRTLTRNFLHVMVDNGRLYLLPDVIQAFGQLVRIAERELDVHITSAIELPDALRTSIEKRMAESTGQQVLLHTSVDPHIIGGLVVQHGDTRIDNSVRGRLEQLRLSLRKPTT